VLAWGLMLTVPTGKLNCSLRMQLAVSKSSRIRPLGRNAVHLTAGETMAADRHIVLRSCAGRWFAAYSNQPTEEFSGDSVQAAIGALTTAKGRYVPGQSAAEIDIADVLAKADRVERGEPQD
jgi:hypothetical protein